MGKGLTNYERNTALGQRGWGTPIALSEISGLTTLFVEGYDAAAAASTDLWDGSAAFPINAANKEMDIVSSVTSDATGKTGAITARVYGVELDGTDWDYLTEDVTLTGDTAVALANEYLCVYKVEVLTAGTNLTNNGNLTTALVTGDTTQNIVTAGVGVSKSAVFPVASGYQAIIDRVWIDMPYHATPQGGTFVLAVKTGTGPWIFKHILVGTSGQPRNEAILEHPIVVPEKSLIKIHTFAITGGAVVTGGFSGVLCDTATAI